MKEKFLNLIKKARVPKFLIPKRILNRMELLLAYSRISFSAREWIGIFFTLGFFLLIIGAAIFSLPVGIGGFLASVALILIIPRIRANKRKATIVSTLPDVLHHMSVSVRSGLVLDRVIQEIADADYGAISEEFSQIVVEMKRGRPLKDALLAFSERSGSKEIDRAMHLLVEGVEFGGPIADVLDEVSDDMRAVRMIQRERRSLTSQQISFLVMASLLAGPFVMGVVASLPTIMVSIVSGYGEAQFPIAEMKVVVTALSFFVVAQAFSSSIMMGVVMYGDFRKGLKFTIPMALGAYGIFSLVKALMPKMIAAF